MKFTLPVVLCFKHHQFCLFKRQELYFSSLHIWQLMIQMIFVVIFWQAWKKWSYDAVQLLYQVYCTIYISTLKLPSKMQNTSISFSPSTNFTQQYLVNVYHMGNNCYLFSSPSSPIDSNCRPHLRINLSVTAIQQLIESILFWQLLISDEYMWEFKEEEHSDLESDQNSGSCSWMQSNIHRHSYSKVVISTLYAVDLILIKPNA